MNRACLLLVALGCSSPPADVEQPPVAPSTMRSEYSYQRRNYGTLVDISDDGTTLLVFDFDGNVPTLFTSDSLQPLHLGPRVPLSPRPGIFWIGLTPDKSKVAVVRKDGSISLVSLKNKE